MKTELFLGFVYLKRRFGEGWVLKLSEILGLPDAVVGTVSHVVSADARSAQDREKKRRQDGVSAKRAVCALNAKAHEEATYQGGGRFDAILVERNKDERKAKQVKRGAASNCCRCPRKHGGETPYSMLSIPDEHFNGMRKRTAPLSLDDDKQRKKSSSSK